MAWPYTAWDALSETADYASQYLPQYAQQQLVNQRAGQQQQMESQRMAMALQKQNQPNQITSWPELFSQYAQQGKLDQAGQIAHAYTAATDPNAFVAKQPAGIGGGGEFGAVMGALQSGDPAKVAMVSRAMNMMHPDKSGSKEKISTKDIAGRVYDDYQRSLTQWTQRREAASNTYVPDPNGGQGTYGAQFNEPQPTMRGIYDMEGTNAYANQLGLDSNQVAQSMGIPNLGQYEQWGMQRFGKDWAKAPYEKKLAAIQKAIKEKQLQ